MSMLCSTKENNCIVFIIKSIMPLLISGFALFYTYSINKTLEESMEQRQLVKLRIMKILNKANNSIDFNSIKVYLQDLNSSDSEIKKALYEMLTEKTIVMVNANKYEISSYSSKYKCIILETDLFELLRVTKIDITMDNIAIEFEKLYGIKCSNNQSKRIKDTLYFMFRNHIIYLDQNGKICLNIYK